MIKRPKDTNQLAKLLVDIATGQVQDTDKQPNVGMKDFDFLKPKKNLKYKKTTANDRKSSKRTEK